MTFQQISKKPICSMSSSSCRTPRTAPRSRLWTLTAGCTRRCTSTRVSCASSTRSPKSGMREQRAALPTNCGKQNRKHHDCANGCGIKLWSLLVNFGWEFQWVRWAVGITAPNCGQKSVPGLPQRRVRRRHSLLPVGPLLPLLPGTGH